MGNERRRHERAPVAGTPLAGLITFIRIRKCCSGTQQEAIYVVNADGTKILFSCVTYGQAFIEDLCVMNADGTGVVDITNTPGVLENFPSWGTAPLE